MSLWTQRDLGFISWLLGLWKGDGVRGRQERPWSRCLALGGSTYVHLGQAHCFSGLLLHQGSWSSWDISCSFIWNPLDSSHLLTPGSVCKPVSHTTGRGHLTVWSEGPLNRKECTHILFYTGKEVGGFCILKWLLRTESLLNQVMAHTKHVFLEPKCGIWKNDLCRHN